MKYIFIITALFTMFMLNGCGTQQNEFAYSKNSKTASIAFIGKDINGDSVYVKEIHVARGSGLSYREHIIFVRCTEDGSKLISSSISNSYSGGKQTIFNTTEI